MVPKRLLAKSLPETGPIPEGALFTGHAEAVLASVELLYPAVLDGLANLTGLPSGEEREAFIRCVRLAALCHDLGKANSDFQEMVRGDASRQSVRHEALSLYWLQQTDIGNQFFRSLPTWTSLAVFAAVAGHHLKYPDPVERVGYQVQYYCDHDDFRQVTRRIREEFNIEVEDLPRQTIQLDAFGNLVPVLNAIGDRFSLAEDRLSEQDHLWIAAVKTTLMCADLIGSIWAGTDQDRTMNWVLASLQKTLGAEDLASVVEARLRAFPPRPFQLQVRDASSNTTLVRAGCGTGKTVAAYLWAQRRAPGKRLFFCYPTTGTASEGFAGYLHDPDFDALLVHHRSHVDYRLLPGMPQHQQGSDEACELAMRVEALEMWPVPAVVCTAHTVLGLFENYRRGIYAWPSLCQGVFVFDEIHAFGDRLFSVLLRFLSAFPRVPVLLMTATLPEPRLDALKRLQSIRGELQLIEGPPEREMAVRYRIGRSDATQAMEQAKACLQNGGKVLWIANTVSRATEVAQLAWDRRLPAELYHSRFRYRDRLHRHRAVVDGFATGAPAMIAVTTQVAEMSLDLSADLLVSEVAPVPAMIQRLGRLNRAVAIPEAPRDAVFIEPPSKNPYAQDDLAWEIADKWLTAVSLPGGVSQADLRLHFEGLAQEDEKVPEVHPCGWLDAGIQSRTTGSITDPGFTVECIREEDLTEDPAEVAIPMPFPPWKDALSQWKRRGFYWIAPEGTVDYSESRGARWVK